MPTYTIWTIGCQMNKAESQRVAESLETLGYDFTPVIHKADLIVLNTCVVRKSAEDRVLGMLGYLKGIKRDNPKAFIVVTGCFVDSQIKELMKRYPHVTYFCQPGDHIDLARLVQQMHCNDKAQNMHEHQVRPIAYVPIIQGCNNYCSYCIVPYRRGREQSRPLSEIITEVKSLVNRGCKEVILVGQNVNSYGHDLLDDISLDKLLIILNRMDGLYRIRFLTNHPKDMSLKLIKAMSLLGKVCEHINLPLQSGDDGILKYMKRDYTGEQYSNLVTTVRSYIPELALSTDIIVGFPGETEEQFQRTLDLVREIRFDTVHVAAYSPRYGTLACKQFDDNVPPNVKKERFEKLEAIQTQIATQKNIQFRDKKVEILVEGKKKGKWYGRTRSDKLVFFEDGKVYLGQLVNIVISKTSPWSLQGEVENS
ncbi:tRNA (N6-isopentenyl adenosine(37)-C2)-methylthiotransferase MiaB [Chloroflexota bacterium]